MITIIYKDKLFDIAFFFNLGQTDRMIMLNVGIGSETETTREINSSDLKNMTRKLGNCQPLDLHSLVKAFPVYSLDSTYKNEEIVHR